MSLKFQAFITFLLIHFLSFTPVWADTLYGPTNITAKSFDELTINGPATLAEMKLKSLVVNGPLTYKKLEVTSATRISGPMQGEEGKFGGVTVSGTLEAQKFYCNALTVNGLVKLINFKIMGDTKINGLLMAKQGSFQNLNMGSSRIVLEDVSVKSIFINAKNDENIENETLYLKGKTTIEENVTFESGKGEIIIDGKDVKINGKINGATTRNQTN